MFLRILFKNICKKNQIYGQKLLLEMMENRFMLLNIKKFLIKKSLEVYKTFIYIVISLKIIKINC